MNLDFFTGKPNVEGLGYNFMFRNYRSELGKWQTADPLGYPDGLNNFAYVNNEVVSCFDYLGWWKFEILQTPNPTTNISRSKYTKLPNGTTVFWELEKITGAMSASNNGSTLNVDFSAEFSVIDKSKEIDSSITLDYSIIYSVDNNGNLSEQLIGSRSNASLIQYISINGAESRSNTGNKTYSLEFAVSGNFQQATSWSSTGVNAFCNIRTLKFKIVE